MTDLNFESPKNPSSRIIQMAYDDASGVAVAQFADGTLYHYEMSRADYEAWRDSDSAGSHLHKVIGKNFPYHKVVDEQCGCFAPAESEA